MLEHCLECCMRLVGLCERLSFSTGRCQLHAQFSFAVTGGSCARRLDQDGAQVKHIAVATQTPWQQQQGRLATISCHVGVCVFVSACMWAASDLSQCGRLKQ